jgi:hypothetical protein
LADEAAAAELGFVKKKKNVTLFSTASEKGFRDNTSSRRAAQQEIN